MVYVYLPELARGHRGKIYVYLYNICYTLWLYNQRVDCVNSRALELLQTSQSGRSAGQVDTVTSAVCVYIILCIIIYDTSLLPRIYNAH